MKYIYIEVLLGLPYGVDKCLRAKAEVAYPALTSKRQNRSQKF